MAEGLVIAIGVYQGMAAQKAASAEAKYIREQAALQDAEAREEAIKVEHEADSFKQKQKMMFLKSGVSLEGSPLLILEKTQKDAEEEADAIRSRGAAQFNLGMRQGDILRRKGRAALIGSSLQGISSAISMSSEKKSSASTGTTSGGTE